MTQKATPWLTLIGINESGTSTLTQEARTAIKNANQIFGSTRQLGLIDKTATSATRTPWPSPMMPYLDNLLTEKTEATIILASGDPLCWGIGQHITNELKPDELHIIPGISIITLICAAMHWPTATTKSLSLCSQPLTTVARYLEHGVQLILLPATPQQTTEIGNYLIDKGYGPSNITILENLGSDQEAITKTTAQDLAKHKNTAILNSLAITLKATETSTQLTSQPGLPDSTFKHDGQLTRQNMRAITLAHLRPSANELLWDIGAGSGSISIEWLRAAPTSKAIAIEKDHTRASRTQTNAENLGVPHLEILQVEAPHCLKTLPTPDAIFIGGGLTSENLLQTAITALKQGGRLVANSVTLEGEQVLIQSYKDHGGTLTKLEQQEADPIGSFHGWRPKLPITQWIFTKS